MRPETRGYGITQNVSVGAFCGAFCVLDSESDMPEPRMNQIKYIHNYV